jgi:hypothetical protein
MACGYGIDYDDTTISTEKTKPGIENPIYYCLLLHPVV